MRKIAKSLCIVALAVCGVWSIVIQLQDLDKTQARLAVENWPMIAIFFSAFAVLVWLLHGDSQ